jgi:hypothetical protein
MAVTMGPKTGAPRGHGVVRPVARGALTLRDALATLFVGAAAAVYFNAVRGWDWPLVGSVRSAGIAMGILGMAACATSDGFVPGEGTTGFTRFGMWGSFVAIGLVVAASITGSEAVLFALAATLAALWVVATARHALGR